MPNRPTVKVRFIFRDRSGNTASTHLYFPFSTSVDDVFAAVNAAIPIYATVSDALIVKVVAEWEHYFIDLAEPSITSDIKRSVLLFYRNEETRIERITILSPRSTIFETTGDYAGIRIDMSNPAIVEWHNLTINDLIVFRTKDGDIIGPDLLTGGLAI